MRINNLSLSDTIKYFHSSGNDLYWNTRPNKSLNINNPIRNLNRKNGYYIVVLNGVKYKVHRLLYQLYHNVELSNELIDHVDGNQINNDIHNLRIASKSTNGMNRTLQTNNTVGYKGVTKHSQCEKYMAQITLNNNRIYIGLYATPELAYDAYCKKAIELFGEFAHL